MFSDGVGLVKVGEAAPMFRVPFESIVDFIPPSTLNPIYELLELKSGSASIIIEPFPSAFISPYSP